MNNKHFEAALEVAASALWESAVTGDKQNWDDLPLETRIHMKRNVRPIVQALHDAGLLKDRS